MYVFIFKIFKVTLVPSRMSIMAEPQLVDPSDWIESRAPELINKMGFRAEFGNWEMGKEARGEFYSFSPLHLLFKGANTDNK